MSSKYLRITEKFTSDLWNNSTPDLRNRGRFENCTDFDLYQCNRNILASQIWLSLLGDGAQILIIHFKNQIPLQMLSFACHSATSQGHPLLGIWKARPQGSPKSLFFLPLSEFHAAWSPQSLCFFLSSTVAEGTSALYFREKTSASWTFLNTKEQIETAANQGSKEMEKQRTTNQETIM